ncbi:hypothetical protein [Haloplanus halophilus]|uniref:hypothetical protein n=1 Tax=Haloplanus halophilus TaxID=2949993 RepID=UPI00203A6C7B|nr:hypothetical protein [Haloplanus sp. GDY1]
MEPTTQRPDDDELAQQAPLVPDLGRRRRSATDGGSRRPTRRVPVTDPPTQRTYDDEQAQEAPLVPDLGRPEPAGDGR